jgi:ligand-binding sensor domain-containing protein/signal transduction histidine kinase
MLVWGASPALADSFSPALTQYAHASWRVQDGDLDGQANSITQTRDGYLWVGTEAGLERYDGTHFRRWALPVEKPVYAVQSARDGSLWIGQTEDVLHFQDGHFTSLPLEGRFNAFYEARNGGIWLARTRGPKNSGGLCTLQGAKLRCFGAAEGQPCEYAGALTQDAKGDFWIGGENSACRWRPGGGEVVDRQAQGADVFGVQAVESEQDGAMLVGFMRAGPGLGLQRITTQGARAFTEGGLLGESLKVTALLRDRKGALWIGTADQGLYHLDQGRVDRFTSADGLSSNAVKALFEDHEGSVWVATVGGMDRFHEHLVAALTTREGLISDNAASVLARRDGSIWISTSDGLNVLRNGVLSRIRASEGLPGHSITSMLEDRAGKLWVGIDDNLTWYDGKKFHIVRKPDGGKLGVIVALAEDERHDIWVLTTGRPYQLHRIRAGKYLDEVHVPGGAFPTELSTGPDGAIWITDQRPGLSIFKSGRFSSVPLARFGSRWVSSAVLRNNDVVLSGRDGVFYLRRGRWAALDIAHGLPCGRTWAVAEDQRGALWIRGQCGLMILSKPDLEHALAHPQERFKARLLDSVDGARPGEPSFQPAVTMQPNGRLWFATDGVLLTADPAHIAANPLPPPVHIEQIIAGHRIYSAANAIAFPPHTRDVEIDYAGLSLYAPQKMHFRYRLSGVDDGWQDVGVRRAAFFMNLNPGKHRFQVIASNNDGIWNSVGDSLTFSIRPTFYQTLWFQLLVGALAVVLVWLGLWLRVRYVAAEIETRLSARQSERMRIARELHDTLLQGFQGLLMRFQVVADAIPKHSPAKPMMDSVLSRAEDVLVEGRERVSDLRSAEAGELSLFDELQHLAVAVGQDESALIEVRLVGRPRALKGIVQREILAITREAAVNACRHSAGTTITCQLMFTRFHVCLVCEDNGVGIEGATMQAGGRDRHWGLTGMRERARQVGGILRIQSKPGSTRIEFRLNTYMARFHAIAAQLSRGNVNQRA